MWKFLKAFCHPERDNKYPCLPERKHTTTPCHPERGYKYPCLPERDNKSPRHPEREHNSFCHLERKHTTTPCLPERGYKSPCHPERDYRRAEGSHVIRVGVNNCSPIHQCLPVKRRFSSTSRRKARTYSGNDVGVGFPDPEFTNIGFPDPVFSNSRKNSFNGMHGPKIWSTKVKQGKTTFFKNRFIFLIISF